MPRISTKIEITRHAYDEFSLRFLYLWKPGEGIGTFLTKLASTALEQGTEVTALKDSGRQLMLYKSVVFVFNDDKKNRTLITVHGV